ncbi:PAS domain-containing methyl-accepting chemotaxis protein [Anoxybacillus ayderensis]|uniref:PAS domain-containing methyl-accepting chemotaxis protein n=1 Tax=Anoxybacillus ayderensis TaxID=265546 RepID=UPI002E1EC5C0|nr:PAS domain-containing methyl-accepting chemotaxis protein [Anoxybacillus ayderensis]
MYLENIHPEHLLDSVSESFAMIIFDLNGKILWANDLFSQVMGYSTFELKHMHHKQFCLSDFSNSPQYTSFWRNFSEGKAFHDTVMRINKHGERLWLDAFYIPVLNDDKKPYAVLKIATDITHRQNVLKGSVNEFVGLVEEMTASTENLHSFSKKIITDMELLRLEAKQAMDSLEEIQAITSFVKDVSSQANLLGLNASIEAARAGEHGKGFAIVANEIRKMADKSKEAVDNIVEKLENFSKLTKTIDHISQNMKEDINNTYTSIDELKKSYEHVAHLAEELSKIT